MVGRGSVHISLDNIYQLDIDLLSHLFRLLVLIEDRCVMGLIIDIACMP